MTRFLAAALGTGLALSAWAQQRTAPSTYGSATGFGSVLYPGTGHAPVIQPGLPGIGTRPYSGLRPVLAPPPRIQHPSHTRRSVVPYPVFVGGYYNGFDGYNQGYYPDPQAGASYQQAPATPPVVIVNQGYVPEQIHPVMHDYSNADLPQAPALRTYEIPTRPIPDPKELAAAREEAERPTIFLIAFKDHTILPALAYWVDGDTLNYVTKEGMPNRASMQFIDKEFSAQLNRERKVDFKLP